LIIFKYYIGRERSVFKSLLTKFFEKINNIGLFKILSFRNKLLLTFLIVFIPLLFVGSTIAYFQVKNLLQHRIEKELQDTTSALAKLIDTSANVSIKNRLFAIAEKNLDIAEYFYSKHRSGLLSKFEAIKNIKEIFLSQTIGISGYIYCLNSEGVILIHPNKQLIGTDVSGYDFVKQQMKIKDGYIEYDWKNPGEEKERPKALYMVYYKSLDWIISVSSYREEFNYLVDLDDLRENILSHKTGNSGYAFVLNDEGTMVIHPHIEGTSVLEEPGYSDEFKKQILDHKDGIIKYWWENPSTKNKHEKLVIYKYLPEFKWIIASSSYVKEVFAPLDTFRNFVIGTLIVVVLSAILITYLISTVVTIPLSDLMDKLEEGAKGDFSVRINYKSSDEFAKLSIHFNSFMGQLEQNNKKIESEIQKNQEARVALVENDLKLRGLFNKSFQYTSILSPLGIIEEVNQTGLDFAGCSLQDILYIPFWESPWWRHDTDIQADLKKAIGKATKGEFVRYETTSMSGENEIRNVDVSIKPILNPANEVILIIAEGRDITELKIAGKERENLAVQLEKSQKIKTIGTLAGGIAHDFNNILSGILGYAQLAELNLESPLKAKGHLTQIVKGAQRAAGLTQQILTFSRKTEFEKHPLSLFIVVKEALKLLRSSIPTTIDITENIDSKAKVMADATQMHQVIMNLCTNAYHAMGETGGNLIVRLKEVEIKEEKDFFNNEMKKGLYLQLEITDTGLGMADETLLKAFDPYFTTKEVGKGTGFGLALVHAIVEEHDGYIKARSIINQGSSFIVYLPVFTTQSSGQEKPIQNKKLQIGTEKIMVVDDEEDIRFVLKAYFESFNYSVIPFENGKLAYEAFKKDPNYFDMIITDMTMPQMTGDILAKKVLTLRNDIPIILCTGYGETITEVKALKVGIKKYVQKPVNHEELVGSVRKLFDNYS
jgi:signal transduction histidine kinase/CheY-like chemotaxis protein